MRRYPHSPCLWLVKQILIITVKDANAILLQKRHIFQNAIISSGKTDTIPIGQNPPLQSQRTRRRFRARRFSWAINDNTMRYFKSRYSLYFIDEDDPTDLRLHLTSWNKKIRRGSGRRLFRPYNFLQSHEPLVPISATISYRFLNCIACLNWKSVYRVDKINNKQ